MSDLDGRINAASQKVDDAVFSRDYENAEAEVEKLAALIRKARSSDLNQWRPWRPERMVGRKIIVSWLMSISEKALERVFVMAEPEHWGDTDRERGRNMRSYLTHYFLRVFEQGDVMVYDRPEGGELIVWNTGLLTPSVTEIFAIMIPHHSRADPSPASSSDEDAAAAASSPDHYPPTRCWEYYVCKFTESYQLTKPMFRQRMNAPPLDPSALPKRAFFFGETPECANYNPNIPLETSGAVDWRHLCDRAVRERRLPDRILDLNLSVEDMAMRFRLGVERAKMRILAHPRLAVPQYFHDKNAKRGELQLLIPVSLSPGSDRADAALTVRVHTGSDQPFYGIGTVLSPSQAYYNARTIQPVDQKWLCDLKNE